MFIGLLRGFQDEAHDRIVDRRKMLLALPMGTGKGLLSVTNVLQPTGWVRAGDVQVGDLLIGRDGHPTKVTGVYPQPEQQLYEVTFVDGASVIVDGPHLWSVQTPDETHAYPDNWRTMSTLDLKDDLYSANGNRRWRIPMLSGPVQYHPVGDLPLDPYTLGVVLGDGWIPKVGRACITTDREVLLAVGASAIRPRPGCYSGSVAVPDELGLAGHRAWEQFIPEQYLRAAPEERLSLLQGLLDTDGSSDRRQHGVEFSSTSEALIDGVVDLVQGLGGIARNKTSRITKYTYNGEKREGRLSWRLNVKLPPHLSPFRLARKRDTYVPPTKYPPVRPIKSIEPATVGESVCFTVDAEDSLYVIKDHVVTHNTVTALAAVETLMEDGTITEPGIILAGSSIKYQWEQEIAKFTDSKAVVVSGTPTQREKTYEDFYNWRQTGIDYLIVTYDSMSNDRKIFRHLPKGFVIADECFPAGTLIDTPTGRVPIQFIQEGDSVLHATGVGRVRRTMSHMTGSLLRVQFTDGSSVVCTPEHKFFTAEGWQPARLLTHGASLVSRDQALRLVWEPDEDISDLPVDSASCSQGSRTFLREVLLREVENVPARDSGEGSHTGGVEEEFGGTEGRPGRPLPRGAIGEISRGSGGMDSRLYGSSEDDMESQREHHQGQARERYWTDAPGAGSVGSAGGAVVLELPRQDHATSWIGLPHQLQGGPCASGFETSRGSRWDVTSQQSQTATGPQEGRSAEVLRVDRIEVLQPGSPEFTRLSGGSDRVTVYNLEVEGHPSYVANGALVHNCTALKGHRSKRSQRAKSLFATTPVKIGLSGTPIENGKPEQLYCADEKTAVLSQRGWLAYTELTTEDRVLTLNHESGCSEWQQVQAVNVFPVEDQEMLLMEHRDHSSLTTPTHRWPVERRKYSARGERLGDERTWATTETLSRRDAVPVAVPCSDLPTDPVHSDALVELVAWLYTEGHMCRRRDGSSGTAVNLSQNPGTVGEKRMAAALFDLFGEETPAFPRLGRGGDSVARWRSASGGFRLNTVAGAVLLSHAPDKVPSTGFLLSLTKAQLDLFIEVSMLADNNGSQHFSQKNPAHADAFQFACTLAGVGTSIRQHNKVDRDRVGDQYQMTAVTLRRRKFFAPVNTQVSHVRHTGVVWCPTTPNGSWFAKREGTTYFTGNSIMEFIDPSVLGRFDLFDRSFIVRNSSGWVDGYKNLGTLHTKMKPAMVRRSFDDPEISAALPTEIVKEPFLVDLDSKTRSVMKRITKDLKEDLTALVNTPGSSSFDLMAHYGQGGTTKEFDQSDVLRGMVMSKITVSRMLCDHPQLVRDSADNYDRGDGLKGSAYASYLKAEGLLDITSTAKLDAVVEVVNEALADPKTKVVIFSTFVGMLDLIAARFTEKSVTYHGGMSAQGRQARKEQFQTDPQTRLFISSDAGGYGVDLPQANVLVNYDLPWQAGALDQRNARPRRVSSTWEYIVIEQAMVRDSLEEWQYQMLAHKTAVSQAILAGRGITATGDVSVPLDSLLSHLQK
jgi:hypothetical protein